MRILSPVEADEDLKTVHDGAVRAVLTETGLWELPSGETPVSAAQNTTDEAVASASESAYFWNGAPLQRPRFMPTTKTAPRPRPSVNPARVVVATTHHSSSSSAAWTSSMISDVVRASEAVIHAGNPQDTEQHEPDFE